MIAFFIGRFQPLHKGHIFDILQASKAYTQVIIGIGSSQEYGTVENPFSFKERRRMIEIATSKLGIKNYEIYAIPDVNNDELWVDSVKSIVPRFNIVITGNEKVKELFEKKGIKVQKVDLLFGINATKIREMMLNNTNWDEYITREVNDYLAEIKGPDRIQNLNNNVSK
jgi:nicotinamide-nucleotide adenylyltransferase